MLTSAHLQQAKDTIEKIVQDKFRTEIKSEDILKEDILKDAIKAILKEAIIGVDAEDKRKVYNFMSSLFLNVMINRLNELGKNAKQDAIIAREMLSLLVREEGGL